MYDMIEREIKNLINTNKNENYKSVIWDGTNDNVKMVSGGLYFYAIKTKSISKTKKIILFK